MTELPGGTFYGDHDQVLHLPGMVITDTVYTHDYVDWHFHPNPYFTFLLQGKMVEVNRQETHRCAPGTLLFHNSQEPHYNARPPVPTRGLHVEIDNHYISMTGLVASCQGSIELKDPAVKTLFRKLYIETKKPDDCKSLSVEELVLKIWNRLGSSYRVYNQKKPGWVEKIREALHEEDTASLSWLSLAAIAGIHPVHLSREFPKFFHDTAGNYIRNLRIEKAASLLSGPSRSLSSIAYDCGFSDQSHFIRSFKSRMSGLTPLQYRKLVKG